MRQHAGILDPMLIETMRQARRLVVAVIGGTIVSLGIVFIVTPGPGWLMIVVGLSVLGIEFAWARRLLRRMKVAGRRVTDKFRRREEKPAAPSNTGT